MAAASHNGLPKSMAMIILMCYVATLFSIRAAAPDNPGSVDNCMESLFNPSRGPEFMMKRMICRDLLRSIAITFRVTGKFPPEYIKALKNLPKFRDDQAALKKFICGLSPNETALKNYGCEKDDSKINL
ncbi:uncharacterized protein [Primulina huaijiensis]|uniref:uncharacterized protein n=1 Tax=Primulina huaijiensis TaxID=1492673 RepID=UPI003CC75AFD